MANVIIIFNVKVFMVKLIKDIIIFVYFISLSDFKDVII